MAWIVLGWLPAWELKEDSLCLRIASCYSRQETWGGWGFESSSKSFNSVTATVFRVLKEIVNIHAEEKEGEEEKVL